MRILYLIVPSYLLASGQSSTLTATLAEQIVIEGFLRLKLPAWLRRLSTRLVAVIPALIAIAIFGEHGTSSLLVLSQVILSLQLPFAVIPLVMFTGDRRFMGELVNPQWIKIPVSPSAPYNFLNSPI